MTKLGRIRETILRNNGGIMEATMSFQIQHVLKSNVRMYFYRFDFYDLVEVTYEGDHIVVYDFPHSGDGIKVIESDIQRYAGYFDSAGLKGKRFLFDTSTKMPVSYNDFVFVSKIPKITFDAEMEFAFILDKKDENYITTKGDVKIYVAHEITKTIDKLALSLFNDSINITEPKQGIKKRAAFFSSFLSGMLNGIRREDIEEGLDGVDINNKLYHSLGRMDFNSDYVENTLKNLKTDKFVKVTKKVIDQQLDFPNVHDVVKEFRNQVFLQDIIEQGLDSYIKRNAINPDKPYQVIIDYEWQSIKSAYIRNGMMFITPTTLRPISYFVELLNSDNVQYILH